MPQLEDQLIILSHDDPDASNGGLQHVYSISGFAAVSIESEQGVLAPPQACQLFFQNGPVKSRGRNGVTEEALVKILIDRFQCFQAGKYACDENAEALAALQDALAAIQARTANREKQGVEGENKAHEPAPSDSPSSDDDDEQAPAPLVKKSKKSK